MSYKGEPDITSAGYAMEKERVSRKHECTGSASKCDDCKNNARLGFVGVLPLCIVTGMKEDGQVVSCPNHEATD